MIARLCLVPGRRYFVQVDGTILNIEGYFTISVEDDGSGFHPPYDTICNAVNLDDVKTIYDFFKEF